MNTAAQILAGNHDNLGYSSFQRCSPTSLNLHENQLSGEIPSEVWDMLEREVEIEIHYRHRGSKSNW